MISSFLILALLDNFVKVELLQDLVMQRVARFLPIQLFAVRFDRPSQVVDLSGLFKLRLLVNYYN